jgi:hypothetical protein
MTRFPPIVVAAVAVLMAVVLLPVQTGFAEEPQPAVQSQSGQYAGLGISGIGISWNESKVILDVVPGGPAAIEGTLIKDDVIVSIGEGVTGSTTDITNMTLDQATLLVRGVEGSFVRIVFQRRGENQTRTVTLRRGRIPDLNALVQQAATPAGTLTRPVSEAYFIVCAIHWAYAQWPRLDESSASLTAQLAVCRKLADMAKLRAHALECTELELLADQLDRVLRDYEAFLVNKGLIHDAAAADVLNEAGFSLLGMVEPFLMKAGPKGWILAGIIGVVDFLVSSGSIAKVEERLVRQEQDRIFADLNQQAEYFQRVVGRVSKARGWSAVDANFVDDARRPQDPFQRFASARQNYLVAFTARTNAEAAEEALYAASLVPPGPNSQELVIQMLDIACEASRDAALGSFEEGNGRFDKKIASRGVLICSARRILGEDPTGHVRFNLAMCLNGAGNADKALAVANELIDGGAAERKLRNNPTWSYNYACLLSLNGDVDKSLDWIRHAFGLGMSNIKLVRADPELANVRALRAKEFADLVSVNLTGNIVWWSILSEDYTITNHSKFAITNLTVKPIIVRKDGRTNLELTVERIEPGDTFTWRNVASISRKDFLSFEFGEWDCDQKDK